MMGSLRPMREPIIGARYEKDLRDPMTGKNLGVVVGVIVGIERGDLFPDRAVIDIGGKCVRPHLDESWKWRAVDNIVKFNAYRMEG